jgi:hypothetical protein
MRIISSLFIYYFLPLLILSGVLVFGVVTQHIFLQGCVLAILLILTVVSAILIERSEYFRLRSGLLFSAALTCIVFLAAGGGLALRRCAYFAEICLHPECNSTSALEIQDTTIRVCRSYDSITLSDLIVKIDGSISGDSLLATMWSGQLPSDAQETLIRSALIWPHDFKYYHLISHYYLIEIPY